MGLVSPRTTTVYYINVDGLLDLKCLYIWIITGIYRSRSIERYVH